MTTAAKIEWDRALFSQVAETEPGLIRTLFLLIDELERTRLDPDVAGALGVHLCDIGNQVIDQAGRIVIDQA